MCALLRGPGEAGFRPPALHVLLSAAELGDARRMGSVLEMLALGSIGVHVRARAPARILYERSVELAHAARESGGWCVVNGRPDIALAASAQAVQLGRAALPAEAVARLRPDGSELRIGVSVHGSEEAVRAVRGGADYLVWGTAYETASHPERRGAGPAGLLDAVRALERAGSPAPVLAIGGIDRDRVSELVSAGADGVVVGRAVWAAPEPVDAAAGLLRALEGAREKP